MLDRDRWWRTISPEVRQLFIQTSSHVWEHVELFSEGIWGSTDVDCVLEKELINELHGTRNSCWTTRQAFMPCHRFYYRVHKAAKAKGIKNWTNIICPVYVEACLTKIMKKTTCGLQKILDIPTTKDKTKYIDLCSKTQEHLANHLICFILFYTKMNRV